MKNAKRFLCLALTLLMVMSTVGVFASFSDVPDTASYGQAISSLNQLGIITGYEDGTFKPDNDVTRAEFCAMLMRSMGYGDIGATTAAELPFSDVEDSNSDISWAIKNISTAYKMGIVNGYEDGTFRPSNNVAYEEAVKMVVCALGYGTGISVDATPWYANYISQATSIGLLKNAQNLGAPEKPASRACIAQMLYDALEIPLVENGVVTTKTLLSDYLGYIKGTGYISANKLTSLEDPDVNLRENQIQIRAKEPNSSVYEIHTYQTDKAAELMDKLGYQIDFYYPKTTGSDDIRSLFSYDLKDNNTLELNSDMIISDDTTASIIRYYPSETANAANANLSSENIVIYNGKLYGANAANSKFRNDMLPNVGTVTLLDSDKDGRYDMVTIWDYDVYYVTSKSSSDYSIIDNTTRITDKTIYLDIDKDSNLEIVDKDGKTVTYSSIATGNVICYAESNYAENGGTEYKRAVVVTDKASGSVSTVISGEAMEIGGKTYNFSDAAPWMNTGNDNKELTMPTTGDNGTYALDILGNVFAYNKSVATTNTNYGYVIAYNKGGSSFSNLTDFQLRVLTQGGSKTDYYFYKGTTINGQPVSSVDDAIAMLQDGTAWQNSGGTEVQQVIKYTTTTVNGRNCLDSIYTVTSDTFTKGGNTTLENDKLYNDSRFDYGQNTVRYASGKLTSKAGSEQLNVNSSYVFVVPDDDNRNDADSFVKKTASGFFSNNKDYSVEAFDVSSTYAAKVVVVYGGSATTEVDETSPVYVLDSLPSQSINDETGDNMYSITGYKVGRSISKTRVTDEDPNKIEWISRQSNSIMRNANAGDIYRAGADSDGFTRFEDQYCLYNQSMIGDTYFQSSIKNWNDADFMAIYGSVYSADPSEGMVVVPEYLGEGEEPTKEPYAFTTANFNSGTLILTYTENNGNIEIVDASADRDAILAGINDCTDGLNPAKVVIYMANGRIKLMAVVEGY